MLFPAASCYCELQPICTRLLLSWGILGFLRFTGTFVEGGWAWSPSGCRYHGPSLEMAGCIVLVSYGVLALEEEIRVYDASDPRQMQHLALSAW